jgi:23S rRNA (guanine745-N1)-methyltransferase
VAGKLAELVVPLIANDSVVVDAGCGEGYYLEQLQAQLLSSTGFTPAVLGFDISKWAVQAATRRLVATWLVASNRNIPLAPGSVDCVLSVFGFPVYGSFMAVLKEGGSLLVVHPGPRHLIELREIIYPSVRHRELPLTQHAEAEAAGFAAGPTSTLQFVTAPLDQTEIAQLLTMTPHLYRASREGKERAAVLDNFPVTVDVVFQLLHPRPGASVTRSTPAQSVAV